MTVEEALRLAHLEKMLLQTVVVLNAEEKIIAVKSEDGSTLYSSLLHLIRLGLP